MAAIVLTQLKKNYLATELECLAVVWAVAKLRVYQVGHLFTVVTDHSSLLWVFKPTKPSTRLIRWALRLQEFTFIVEYTNSRYNTVPDALSSAPNDSNESTHSRICATIMSAIPESSVDLSISIESVWNA